MFIIIPTNITQTELNDLNKQYTLSNVKKLLVPYSPFQNCL